MYPHLNPSTMNSGNDFMSLLSENRRTVGALTLALLFLFRSACYNTLISYRATSYRPYYEISNPQLINFLENHHDIKNAHFYGVEDIVKTSLNITSECLRIETDPSTNNPNKLFDIQKADCDGYASFFNSVCNYLLEHTDANKNYRVQHLTGNMYLFRHEINTAFRIPYMHNHNSPHDHHFNSIENLTTGEKTYVDPIMHRRFCLTNINVESDYSPTSPRRANP